MGPLAAATLNDWNQRKEKDKVGLVAVTFDQRNHGSREVDPLSNEAWRSGNERHAQDMFSIYHATSTDTSVLITYLSSYIFPSLDREITTNIVLGVSLGGHAAWQCLCHDPRVSTAIVVIGCPDYFSLMSDRARLSKLPSWTRSSPPGTQFLGSQDFPPGLVKAVETYDPAGMLLGKPDRPLRETGERTPSAVEQAMLLPLMKRSFQGKRVLNLSGGADKLVPYKCGQAFIRWLGLAVKPGSWFADGVHLEDLVFDNVGHQMSPDMVSHVLRFIAETLQEMNGTPTEPVVASQPDQQVVKEWTKEELKSALILKDFLTNSAELLEHLNNRFGKNRTHGDGEAIKRLGELLAKRLISDSGIILYQDGLLLDTAPGGSSSAEASTVPVTAQTHDVTNETTRSSLNHTDNNGVSVPSLQTSNDQTSSTTNKLLSILARSRPDRKTSPQPFPFFEDAFSASMYDDVDGGFY
ncbi:MAG: hypothetical protein Q9181_006529 [Wetmoreana brouardii]